MTVLKVKNVVTKMTSIDIASGIFIVNFECTYHMNRLILQ